jgi:hypothetical protein
MKELSRVEPEFVSLYMRWLCCRFFSYVYFFLAKSYFWVASLIAIIVCQLVLDLYSK